MDKIQDRDELVPDKVVRAELGDITPIPPHPTLWAARQRQPSRKHCARSPAARRAVAPQRTRNAKSRDRRTPRAAASMSVLRWPYDRHRDFRARLRAEAPARATSSG